MIFEKIPCSEIKFTHIIHVADIHIRLTKRHEEYREVFQKFYEEVQESPPSSIVCILGDVCHSKSDLSPECVQMVSEFLSGVADLRETILVPGNHDATLSNKTRLDSLSPIVEALDHPKLHYLTKSQLYGIGDVLFNNMCIFDQPEKYIRGEDIPDIYRNEYKHIVALFHGPVDRSVTDTGFAISNPAIMPPLFDWNDIALLGDIHRQQNMQEYAPDQHKPCVHYPGSMIQQNHGEMLHPHGYTLWDLNTYDYQFKKLHNNYGYFTVELHGAKILTDLDDIPAKTYLRIKCLDSIPTEIKAAEAMVSTLTEIVESSRIRVESEVTKKAKEAKVCKDIKLTEVADVDYQSHLITEFLKTKLNLTDQAKIDRILLINRNTNVGIKKDEFARNLKWIPIRFEWDNMFTYGEGNVVDFTQMKGVYGVFGPNACGKSSLFSALCFCLFDKWERGFKAVVVRNVAKEGFRCKFEFEISGTRYFIEKVGTTTRTGNVKVQVNFWRIVNGTEEDLTDVMRRKTNDIIKEYVGSFEDFILTTLSIQNGTKNNVSFIDMGNTDRKDLLVQFMGLVVFDRLYEAASEKAKELNIKLKPHKEKNYIKDLDDAESTLKVTEITLEDCQDEISDLSKQIKNVNDSVISEISKLIKLDADVPTDIKSLEDRRKVVVNGIENFSKQLELNKTKLEEKRKVLQKLDEELSETLVEDLVMAHKKYHGISEQLNKELRTYELKKVEINNKLDKLKKLSEYKYDPNCKFCVENVFVKDARRTEKELAADEKEMQQSLNSIEKLKKEKKEWDWVEEAYQTYTNRLNAHSKAKDEFSTLNTQILLTEKDVEKITQNFTEVEKKIELYHKNEVSVENNQKVNMTILTFKNALNKLETSLNLQNKKMMEFSGNKEVLKSKIESILEMLQDIMDTEEERELYDYYKKAVGRNGIPYQVICNTIPEITREINSLLTQTTDFTIEIEFDEKNITPYVNYDTKGRWPIEMTSGFERFVASVAIRVALGNVSNLPRSTFLVLDEGFGTLDGHNLPSMYTLFTCLKSNFEFIMVVSHLDSLKDMVDKQIEISQIGNFSKVVFE